MACSGTSQRRPAAPGRRHQHPAPRRESVATTYERLKKIVVEQLGADEDEVKPEASFVDDLNADSLDLVELIMSSEEELGTEISDEEAEKTRPSRTPSITSTSTLPNRFGGHRAVHEGVRP